VYPVVSHRPRHLSNRIGIGDATLCQHRNDECFESGIGERIGFGRRDGLRHNGSLIACVTIPRRLKVGNPQRKALPSKANLLSRLRKLCYNSIMRRLDDFRKNAEACRKLASRMPAQHRAQLLQIASAWDKMADAREAAIANDVAPPNLKSV
jgi:hypothetical protein